MIILIVISVLFLIIGVGLYNSLIGKKNKIEYAFSSIDVMLKKRRDLIPNLVAAAKQYMTHEAGILTRITELRSQLQGADQMDNQERFALEGELGSALGQIRLAFENYPDLKANQNILQLQASLNEVEEQLSAARRAYNGAVYEFNTAIESFPSNIVAGFMNLDRRESFELLPAERENVDVSDLFNKN